MPIDSYGQRIDRDLLGDLLGFASWCFWRCPPGIVDIFLDTYEGAAGYSLNANLLREGAARVVSRPQQIERYFRCVQRRLTAARLVSAEYAGIGRVLRTSEAAAVILDRALADRILQQTVDDLSAENREGLATAYKKRFKAALLMLAALLRHREASPAFLKPDHAAASQLLAVLDQAEVRNRDFAVHAQQRAERMHGPSRTSQLAASRRFAGNAEIIAELKAFIRLQGHDPNIIRRIDAIDDGDGDGA